nr:uncharacterized protein LOC124812222 isoform X2 [Hydra vulgaris]
MHVGRLINKSTEDYTMLDQFGNRKTLESTNNESDLGIIVSHVLIVKYQVEAASARANCVLGSLKKAFRSRGLSLWKVLYTIYVRPHLEFAIQAWSPHLQRDIIMLECIQQRATKTVTEIKHKSYEERLQILGLTTLEERRNRGDLIQQFKIVQGIEKIEFAVPQVYAPSILNYCLRGHNRRLIKQVVKNCEERKHFFTNQVVNAWNSLPAKAAYAVSLNSFKDHIDGKVTNNRHSVCL